jgi:uncharacterized protein YjiS (DUF1127 family)
MSGHQHTIGRRTAVAPARRAGKGRLATFVAWLRTRLRNARTRRDLVDQDPRVLADLGISRAQARHWAARPFWESGPPYP